MSRPVIETKTTKIEPTHSTVRTGKKYYVGSLGQYIQIVALDGRAAAINTQYGHRIAGSIDHPGMNKDYTVAEAREILGRYADELGVIPKAAEKTEEITTLKVGDFVKFGGELALVTSTANRVSLIALKKVYTGRNWSDEEPAVAGNITVADVRKMFKYTSAQDAVILDKSEVPAAIAKALGVSLTPPATMPAATVEKEVVDIVFYTPVNTSRIFKHPRFHLAEGKGRNDRVVEVRPDLGNICVSEAWNHNHTFTNSFRKAPDAACYCHRGDTLKIYESFGFAYLVSDGKTVVTVEADGRSKESDGFTPEGLDKQVSLGKRKLYGTVTV